MTTMRAKAAILCAALAGTLAACTEFPALDGRISPQAAAAPFPELQPLPPLLAQAATPPQITGNSVQAADSRIVGLRDKAAALRGSAVVDPATQTRMQAGVDQSGL